MFIVDKRIKEMCNDHKLIIDGYNPDNVGSISYDLTIDDIIVPNEQVTQKSFELLPNQTVFVSSKETIHVPSNMVGIVSEKNSVMRQGLLVNAPYYQPGHKTKCFIRVTNISSSIITLTSGKKIAQILFSQLSGSPNQIYSDNKNASFNNEMQYTGFGNYESEYKKEIKAIKKAEQDLDEKANSIYANVLTLMGIISAIFAMITINFEAFKVDFSVLNILSLNLSMAFIISILMGLILLFINKKRAWWVYLVFGIYLVILLVLNIVICCIPK